MASPSFPVAQHHPAGRAALLCRSKRELEAAVAALFLAGKLISIALLGKARDGEFGASRRIAIPCCNVARRRRAEESQLDRFLARSRLRRIDIDPGHARARIDEVAVFVGS